MHWGTNFMKYFSKTTKGFYTTEIHGTNIPSDCVEISDERYNWLLEEQNKKGKQIEPDKNGYPEIGDVVITWEQIRSQRDALLKDSDWAVAGDATPKPSKEAWLTYRQTLRDLPQSFSSPEEIIWPNKPE